MNNVVNQTERTRLRRLPKRGDFDRGTINAVLDEASICEVGFVADEQKFVIPKAYSGDDWMNAK